MDLGIAGRSAVVCASSRGLGFACANALEAEGVDVVINGRDETALAAVLDRMAIEPPGRHKGEFAARPLDDSDNSVEVRSTWVLAADGASSRVRKSLGIEMALINTLRGRPALTTWADWRQPRRRSWPRRGPRLRPKTRTPRP